MENKFARLPLGVKSNLNSIFDAAASNNIIVYILKKPKSVNCYCNFISKDGSLRILTKCSLIVIISIPNFRCMYLLKRQLFSLNIIKYKYFKSAQMEHKALVGRTRNLFANTLFSCHICPWHLFMNSMFSLSSRQLEHLDVSCSRCR